ncbi:major facilitator superfamily domain-containing protein [Boletus reticuloceps]|uniref:Major facilitator superfamily domain-containing protein n=1 Tax=Boletus reticuloceps TaxID=495285 RepID=A0A8I3AA36_9AGAM|nr:major facilitator superfamily domain-containing protein [Boletus reticuloceps]
MSTEESPLLRDQPNTDTRCSTLPTKDVYDRFKPKEKRMILAIVSLTGLVPMFVSGCFVPLIPQISKDLNSTPTTVCLGVTMAVFASPLSDMIWSAYSSYYGRRPMYLCGLPFTILASFAVATSTNINSLLFWRFVQMFGCNGGFVLGTAAVGDIFKVEERGSAMGTFFGSALFGLAMAPPVGGALSQCWSWRGFQAALGVWSILQLLLLVFFFPETAHPGSLGIDRVTGPKKLFVWVNPLRCLVFLRSPNIMSITLMHTVALIADYVLLVPIAYTVGAKYGIQGEGMIGALFLPNGLGNFGGAAGKGKAQRGMGPEDRLRAVWIGALVLVPISMILSGFTTAYVDGTVGLVINLVCFFTTGVGVDMIFAPIGAYVVDISPSRSAEVMAAIGAFRSLFLAPVTALLIPSVETIGVAATNSISGIFAFLGYSCVSCGRIWALGFDERDSLIWLTIRYGAQMRAYADVGYPDFDTGTSYDDGMRETEGCDIPDQRTGSRK